MPLTQLASPVFKQRWSDSDAEPSFIDIVAVHGLDQNEFEAWTDPSTMVLWLRDLLPQAIGQARVSTFGYAASASSFYGIGSSDRIQQHAHTLIADLQADRALEGCSERPLIFICHGLGGILVKKALSYSASRISKNVEHLHSIFTSTYAVLFFGTPHLGLEIWARPAISSKARSNHASLHDSQMLSAIAKNSETLEAITDQFAPLMKQFHVFFFWEELQSDLGDRVGYVVDETSAAPIMDNTERAGIYANHAQMVRFSHIRSSSYRTVVEALARYCREAPAIISRRWQQTSEALALARSNEALELAGTAFDVHNNDRPFHFERKISEGARNKFFFIPQVVSSIFTGREETARSVMESLFSPVQSVSSQQRRFVIHGIGGSGKTQFCSKLAQDNRERFWGVFWIDATSTETAKHSFAKVGKLGGMEATQSAGKHWLSNMEEPWLLILDNADDPSLDLTSLFPEGERGHVLVTTRNPGFRIHATVGAVEFMGLAKKEALHLLLRAADFPKPWDSNVEDHGNKITDTLGYLALALIQAGALILQRICKIDDYLGVYEKFRKRIKIHESSRTFSPQERTVYATWEHSIESLESRGTQANLDAIQVLCIVAFYHFEHVRVDVFIRAVANRSASHAMSTGSSLIGKMLSATTSRLRAQPILPNFVRQGNAELDPSRIRHALHVLRSFSLISYDSKNDSFSLHPLVHSWARDRLTRGEQHIWAETAFNVLGEAILLPPNDAGESHEEFRRDILPHLDRCLQGRPIQILDYKAFFGGYKFPVALILRQPLLHVFRDQVLNAAKCGYVYAERGRFNEAAVLLSQVKHALVQSRGQQNELTMRAMLGLAGTLWGLGRLEEAIALQKDVVKARGCSLGDEHPDTLSAMDQLGRSLWLDGQYKEALELQKLTLQRMQASLGPKHLDTLSAMDNLGVTYGSWQKFQVSMDLHSQVLTARKSSLGPHHVDTLTTMGNLAMAYKDLGLLSNANALATEVYEQRKIKLGKEHPWTLWSLCNLSKVNTELGIYQDAENMLVPGIAAAKRSLGDDHLGVLMGMGELTRLYARQKRYPEAEKLSGELINGLEASRGPGHPDTVYAIFKTAQMYEDQGKIDIAVQLCQRAQDRIPFRLTNEHPMAEEISLRLQRLQQDGQKDPQSRAGPPVSLRNTENKQLRSHKTF